MNFIRKKWLALGALVTPALCMADGTVAATTVDDALAQLQTDFTGILGKVLTIVVAIIAVAAGIWAVMLAFKKGKGAGNKA